MLRSIGLLSGTFDPVHLGHLALAQAAFQQLGLDEVWLLVNAYPQHKTGVTPFEHRLAMVQLAAKGTAGVVANREPVQRRAQRHSVAMARELAADYPDSAFRLIMGGEVFAGLNRWDGWEELLGLVSFGVALSGGADTTFIDTLKQRMGASAATLSYKLIEIPPVVISSTSIKQKIRSGQPAKELAPAVRAYIQEHELYR